MNDTNGSKNDVNLWLEVSTPKTGKVVMMFGPFKTFDELKTEALARAKVMPQYSYTSVPMAKNYEPDPKNMGYFVAK
jgi:hypothetical protein